MNISYYQYFVVHPPIKTQQLLYIHNNHYKSLFYDTKDFVYTKQRQTLLLNFIKMQKNMTKNTQVNTNQTT